MKLTFDQWSFALAMVESRNEEWPSVGDGGQAIGRWQQHPSFFAQWYHPQPGQWHDTWDEAFRWALSAFYWKACAMGTDDVAAAVGFHLHGQPSASAEDLASADGANYAAAFRKEAGL